MRNSSPDFTKLHTKTSKTYVFCWLICFVLLFVNLAFPVFGFSYALEITPIIDNPLSSDEYWVGTEATLDIESRTIKKIKIMSCSIKSAEECSYFFINYLNNFVVQKGYQYTFNIELKNDINLGTKYWNNVKIPANCTLNFEGNFHHIYGLKLDGKISMGLISSSSSGDITFENLRIHSICCGKKVGRKTNPAQIIKDANIGAFLGSKTAGSVTIDNCYTYGNYYVSYTANSSSTLSISTSSGNIGGFVGSCYALIINNSTNTITISALNVNYVGGFVGKTTSACRMELCSNLGTISGDIAYVGGLIGYAKGLDLSNSQCCNLADVSTSLKDNISDRGYAGGLVGYIGSCVNSTISYVFNNNKVSSTYGVAGGLVGDSNIMISFSNVYNSGDVVTKKNLGVVEKSGEPINLKQDSSYPLEHRVSYAGGAFQYIEEFTYRYIDCKVVYEKLRDVSLIGNDFKLISRDNNCYSIKPKYINLDTYSPEFKFLTNIELYKNSDYDNETLVESFEFKTGTVAYYQNQKDVCLAYQDPYSYSKDYFYNNTQNGYQKICCIDKYNYENNATTKKNDYSLGGWTQYMVGDMTFNTYVDNTIDYISYSIMESEKYDKYGFPDSATLTEFGTKFALGSDGIYLKGVRMYVCFDNEGFKDLIVCPLMEVSYCYYGKKNKLGMINVPFMVEIGKPGKEAKNKLIKVTNISNEFDNIEAKFVQYSTIDQIKSASFDSKFGQKNSINNGMPVFKDMYWELSV